MACIRFGIGLACFALLLPQAALAVTRLPADRPENVAPGVTAVCTGIGLDARMNGSWAAYPLKIEVAGRSGQFLGDVTLALSRDGTVLATVQCDGPGFCSGSRRAATSLRP